jgi:hypothetical protein
MNAWNHLLSNHLEDFPRAYALSAKQKSAYCQHEQRYWKALRLSAARVMQRVWAFWVAQARCDQISECKRRQYRVGLA